MGFRDPHAILLNRSSILVVTSVGVALLTLSYVLGVQVGKQSAALQRPTSKGSGEDLKALPARTASRRPGKRTARSCSVRMK